MTGGSDKRSSACGGGCSRCSTGSQRPGPGELSGWRMSLAAGGMFLGPLLLAMTGVVLFDDSPATEFVGGAGGLIVGIILAATVARFLRRPCKEAG